ncbi:hypothetical protein ACMT4L_16865 [Deinococcus sp. A31D244]
MKRTALMIAAALLLAAPVAFAAGKPVVIQPVERVMDPGGPCAAC